MQTITSYPLFTSNPIYFGAAKAEKGKTEAIKTPSFTITPKNLGFLDIISEPGTLSGETIQSRIKLGKYLIGKGFKRFGDYIVKLAQLNSKYPGDKLNDAELLDGAREDWGAFCKISKKDPSLVMQNTIPKYSASIQKLLSRSSMFKEGFVPVIEINGPVTVAQLKQLSEKYPGEDKLLFRLTIEGARDLRNASPIKAFRMLQQLSLYDSSIKDIQFIQDLPMLRVLNLRNSKVDNQTIQSLENHPTLEELYLNNNSGVTKLDFLNNIPLKKLTLWNTEEVNNTAIKTLENHPTLVDLDLGFNKKITRLAFKNENLRKLTLRGEKINDDFISDLPKNFPNLEDIKLLGTKVSTLDSLIPLSHLKKIYKGRNSMVSDANVLSFHSARKGHGLPRVKITP